MYNNRKRNFNRSSSRGSRSSFQGRNNRHAFSHHRGGRGGTSHRGPKGENIDISRFVNKAVAIAEEKPYVPEHAFSDFPLDERLKRNISEKNYKNPTPIQDKAISIILQNSDLIGIANTGTGKTAAFLIPLINKVLKNPKENVLIMVPTRELALQIEEELRSFTKGMKIFSVCCVGGAPIGRQIKELRYHNNFIIGTPGRLKDLVERKCIRLSEFGTVVLDEADRMLDMGFIADMRAILSKMAHERQTLFFSATFSKEIETLTKEFLKDPIKISVKTGDTSKNVDQDVIRIGRGVLKIDVLHDLLIKEEFNKVLIFGKTKRGVEKLSTVLSSRGLKVESIHGDKNHSRRQKALRMFKGNQVRALIATDVAARGLDISDVSHVINYDIPATYDDYIHRIGRTGRGNKKGKALTFVE